jgi:hypothetical protein
MAMKRHAFLGRSEMRFGWAFAALVVATAFPLSALAADRVVLAEDFTNNN